MDFGVFGILGVGGGFVLGVKLCRFDSDVWIIYGDGFFGYSVVEFDIFIRYKVKRMVVDNVFFYFEFMFLVFVMFYLNFYKEDWIICLLSVYKCYNLFIVYELI